LASETLPSGILRSILRAEILEDRLPWERCRCIMLKFEYAASLCAAMSEGNGWLRQVHSGRNQRWGAHYPRNQSEEVRVRKEVRSLAPRRPGKPTDSSTLNSARFRDGDRSRRHVATSVWMACQKGRGIQSARTRRRRGYTAPARKPESPPCARSAFRPERIALIRRTPEQAAH